MTKSAVASKRLALDKRREHRMRATRPVRLERGTGVTRNISMSGVFFVTDVDYAPGNVINFAIELDGPAGQKLMLGCRGMIVRVERQDGNVGVAAKIVASKLETTIHHTPASGRRNDDS